MAICLRSGTSSRLVPAKEENEDSTYKPMPKSPGSNIAWDAYVAYKSGSITTPKALGNHIAKKFNEFMDNSNEVRCFVGFASC